MKIAQISTRAWPYPAGLEEFLFSLAKELAVSGHDVTLMATNSSGEFSVPQIRLGSLPLNMKNKPFPSGNEIINSRMRIRRAKTYFRLGPFHITDSLWGRFEKDFDVLHLHSMIDFPFWLPIIRKAKTKNLFVTVHDVAPSVANKIEATFWDPYARFLVPRILEKFCCVIVPSMAQIQFLKNIGFETSKITLIPLCFDERVEKVQEESFNRQFVRKRYDVEPNEFLIVSIGRLIPVKRFDMIIKALSLMSKDRKLNNVKCLIIGADEGSLAQLLLLSKQLQMDTKIRFIGKRNHMDTLRLLQAADLFVMPSADEAFNLSTIESMALSVPVLVSSGMGVTYLLKQNENGTIFKRNDLSDLTRILSNLIENHDQLRHLAIEGKKTAYTFCSPQAIRKKHLEVYRRFAT